jgi:hypothetical protein
MGRRLEDDLEQGFASHQAMILRGHTALVSASHGGTERTGYAPAR